MNEPTKEQLENRKRDAPGLTTDSDTFLKTLQSKILGQSSMVSSSSTGLETKIQEALGGIQKAGIATGARIESQAGREIASQAEKFAQEKTSALESQRGFATNTAALRALDERTEKSLRDLEQRKQELILQGESATASRISELQFKSLEFQQKAAQDSFNNILQVGEFARGVQGLQLQIKQEARMSTAQEWEQKFNEEKFRFEQAITLTDQRQGQIRLNIMSQELKLKSAEQGLDLIADPGFGSVSIQNQVGNESNRKLIEIQQKISEGKISEGVEEESETIKAYLDLRRTLSRSQVSDDALASSLGLKMDENGELGFITGNVEEVRLPGELPFGVPALGAAKFVLGLLEKPGEGIGYFFTGKRPTGFVK